MHSEQFFWNIFDESARWWGVECIWIESGVSMGKKDGRNDVGVSPGKKFSCALVGDESGKVNVTAAEVWVHQRE